MFASTTVRFRVYVTGFEKGLNWRIFPTHRGTCNPSIQQKIWKYPNLWLYYEDVFFGLTTKKADVQPLERFKQPSLEESAHYCSQSFSAEVQNWFMHKVDLEKYPVGLSWRFECSFQIQIILSSAIWSWANSTFFKRKG